MYLVAFFFHLCPFVGLVGGFVSTITNNLLNGFTKNLDGVSAQNRPR